MNPEIILKILVKHPELFQNLLPDIKDIVDSQSKKAANKGSAQASPVAQGVSQPSSSAQNNTNLNQIKAKNFGPTKGEVAALDVVLPMIGDAASVVGNLYGGYNSLLGQAILAMHNENTKNWTGAMGKPNSYLAALPYQVKGLAGATIGNAISNRAYTIADTLKENNRQARDKEFQTQYDAPGMFWESQRVNIPTKQGSRGK